MANREKTALRYSDQVHEARGFDRVFHNNPDIQAQFVRCLLGFLATQTEFGESSRSESVVRALETIIRDFAEKYPEFREEELQRDPEVGRGTYRMDRVLEREINRVLYEGQGTIFDGYRL